MAETLPNGTVIPQGSDLINSNGVQAMRNLGSSVDGQLGNRSLVGHTHSWSQITDKPTNYSPSTHTHPISQVTGLQAALDGKVGTADPRLSDARTPTAHTHTVEDVTGLTARLAVLEYRSGLRNISGLATAGWSDVQATAWRIGAGVNIAVSRLGRTAASSSTETVFTLPSGYRPPDTIVVRSGRGMVARILTSGAVQVIAPGISVDYFAFSFDTLQAPATTEPGVPV